MYIIQRSTVYNANQSHCPFYRKGLPPLCTHWCAIGGRLVIMLAVLWRGLLYYAALYHYRVWRYGVAVYRQQGCVICSVEKVFFAKGFNLVVQPF